jgi:hypothetical protein
VLLGVEKRWHFPLLFCRALSTAPAVWWGLRCALTFLGELLRASGEDAEVGKPWSVERRFRVTEVFLAVLWVRTFEYLVVLRRACGEGEIRRDSKGREYKCSQWSFGRC